MERRIARIGDLNTFQPDNKNIQSLFPLDKKKNIDDKEKWINREYDIENSDEANSV